MGVTATGPVSLATDRVVEPVKKEEEFSQMSVIAALAVVMSAQLHAMGQAMEKSDSLRAYTERTQRATHTKTGADHKWQGIFEGGGMIAGAAARGIAQWKGTTADEKQLYSQMAGMATDGLANAFGQPSKIRNAGENPGNTELARAHADKERSTSEGTSQRVNAFAQTMSEAMRKAGAAYAG